MSEPVLLQPTWATPAPEHVGAAMSTRRGGVSSGSWSSLNLGGACGDDPAHVATNRQRFAAALGTPAVWLRQVHGTAVLRLDRTSHQAELPPADAAWTTEPGLACAVLVADCLPVLFAARDGSAVAAAHAGWRGLAAGVLEATLLALRQGTGVQASEIQVWLGPCIGPQAFEVGADVLAGFGCSPSDADPGSFAYRAHADGTDRWLANLPHLARLRLLRAGVSADAISASGRCTFSEPSDFFSFRRDGVTGRLAAAVWRRG